MHTIRIQSHVKDIFLLEKVNRYNNIQDHNDVVGGKKSRFATNVKINGFASMKPWVSGGGVWAYGTWNVTLTT